MLNRQSLSGGLDRRLWLNGTEDIGSISSQWSEIENDLLIVTSGYTLVEKTLVT